MSNSYCAAAFRQIYSDNAGRYRLCCHADDHPDLVKTNTRNTTPFEHFLSDAMENIRDDMFSGKPIKGCETCYKAEEQGSKSWREWKYNTIYEPAQIVEKVSLKLRILGSYCNLGCYMCSPYNSSTRRVELQKSGISNFKSDDKVVNISTKRYNETVQDILNNIELVDHMHITGGEPLLLPRMWEMLDQITLSDAKNITLSFDTNLSSLTYKNYHIEQLAEKFKKIDLGVSCDHFGEKLHWIRYPLDVKQFERNISDSKHLISSINVTVSILNIMDLHAINDYYDNTVSFNGINKSPTMLSIRNLPIQLKHKIYQMYESNGFDILLDELMSDPIPGDLEKGLDYCRKLDANRPTDFDSIFHDLIKNIQSY